MSKTKSIKNDKKSAAKSDQTEKTKKKATSAKAAKPAKPAEAVDKKSKLEKKAAKAEKKADKRAAKAARQADKDKDRDSDKAKAKGGKSRPFDLAARLAGLFDGAEDTPPKLPIKVAIFEAERTVDPARRLRDRLAALPDFDLTDVDHLPQLILALSTAENDWLDARAQKAELSLGQLRRDAERLRGRMMSSLRYLLRRDDGAQRTLDEIAEGDGIADLVDDLHKLARIWETRPEAQADVHLRDDASEQARTYATTLASGADSEVALAALAQRNRVYWALERALTEIRSAASYLLASEPKKLAAFGSRYHAEKVRRNRSKPAPTPAKPEPENP